MSHQRPQAASATQGLKTLISALAVAATLGGWAALARTDSPPAAAGLAVPAGPDGPAPLPTLAPLASTSSSDVAAGGPAAPPALRDVSAPPHVRPDAITFTRSSR